MRAGILHHPFPHLAHRAFLISTSDPHGRKFLIPPHYKTKTPLLIFSTRQHTYTLMPGNRKRHCWECRRRSLVCDFAVPECSRCAASGIDCPGYGETAPPRIRWLMPGQINSQLKGASRGRSGNGKAGQKGRSEISKEGLGSTESLALAQRLASPGSLESAEHAQRSMAPRLELKTETHAQMEAFDYCVFRLPGRV